MTKLTSTIAILAALGLTSPALAQSGVSTSIAPSVDANASTSTDATNSRSVDATTSTSVDATASTSTDATATSADSASSAPSTTTNTNADVNITTEQKTEIHQAITEINVQPVVNINFDVNVGVAVPKTVVLTPLPARIIKVFPRYKGFLFFLLQDGRIVIVDPSSLKVVIVIT
jgi:hypothetical protein